MGWRQLLEQLTMYAVPLRLPFNLSFIYLMSSDWSRRVWLLNSPIFRSSLYFLSRLTLGGGVGLLSGEHGLVIDNLLKVIYLLDHVISA